MQKNRLLSTLAADVIIWFSAPGIFLYLYIHRYLISGTSVLPHLRLVLLIFLIVTVLRITLSKFIRHKGRLHLTMGAIVSTVLSVMLAYYSMVLIGLESWGRVISWDLITGYVGQVPELANAVGISLIVVGCILAIAYLVLLTAAYKYYENFDWTFAVSQRISGYLFAFLIIGTTAISAIETWRITTTPDVHAFEPVALTLFPMEASRSFQNNPVDQLAAARLDQIEENTRASYTNNSRAQRRNVILIVVDALRPDHMGIYGYGRDTTPTLSRMEKAGLLYKAPDMHASCSESACGLLSISSSKFVHQFSNKPITLQEVLKRHGYRIHMILSGDHANFYGLREAYGEVDTYFDGSMAHNRYANDDNLVLDKLASLPQWDGVPVMMHLHLMSAHILGKRHVEAEKFQPATSYVALRTLGKPETDRSLNQLTVNHYDNGVLQTDIVVSKVLESLNKKGYLQDAVAIITADHGELLGEHGLFSHANSVYEQVLRVPFLMIPYGYQSTGFSKTNFFPSQVDIAPTILAELDVPRPHTWAGFPLQESHSKQYAYFQQGLDVGLFHVQDRGGLWKYWINKKTGEEFVFDVTNDPGEIQNRINEIQQQSRHEWQEQLGIFPKTLRSNLNNSLRH